MYLVELRPGKEELYRTGDELAAAIRSGDVDMHSRIYHRATSKWISVTLHPQYKAIVDERPAEPPLPPLERSTWTFFNDSADTLAGANDPAPEAEAKSGEESDPNQTWGRPLALSVTGVLLILGLQLAASGPRPPWSGGEAKSAPPSPVLPASAPVNAPASATVSLASNTNWVADDRAYIATGATARGLPAASAAAPAFRETPPAAVAPSLPAAPKIRTKVLLRDVIAKPLDSAVPSAAGVPARAMSALVQGWTAAHDSTRVRLESGIRVARLSQLFATGRLSPGGGVTETRMSLAGVANFVRVYHQQQAAIEREFQDSFSVVSRQHGWTQAQVREWYSKPSARESPTLVALTSSLMAEIDSLFGVLDAQAGAYTVTKNTIRFEDEGAARQYGALRQQILAAVDAARTAGGAEQPGPMNYLLQAIGTTRLPSAI